MKTGFAGDVISHDSVCQNLQCKSKNERANAKHRMFNDKAGRIENLCGECCDNVLYHRQDHWGQDVKLFKKGK